MQRILTENQASGIFEFFNKINPVAAVWELPDDPEAWPAIERLLDDLEPYGIERLSKPLDE